MSDLSAQMPSWFAVYPEFDVGVARRCVEDIESFRSVVWGVRNEILGVENFLKRDGAGVWFDEYSRQSRRVWWWWLSDVCVKLSRLVGYMEEVISEAHRASYRKEQAWGDIQRYMHPLSETIVPVSASVALRDYACFKTREYPLQIPYLQSPVTLGFVIDNAAASVAGVFSRADTVGADTDALRIASDVWYGMGGRYRRVFSIFEEATWAWGRDCGRFAPANFTFLLESLYCFPRIADQWAERLADTARRFDETQNESFLFGVDAFTVSARFSSDPTPSPSPGPKPVPPDEWDTSNEITFPEWDTIREFIGIPHTWNFTQWSGEEWLDVGLIAASFFGVGVLAKGGQIVNKLRKTDNLLDGIADATDSAKGIQNLKNTGKTDNANNLKHVDDVEVKNLPTKEQALKNATRTADNNLDDVLKIDGARLTSGGRFGVKDKGAQVWKSENPDETAKEVFEKLTKGGVECEPNTPVGYGGTAKVMSDGRMVIYRPDSSSTGPAIDIQKTTGGSSQIAGHRIHFKPLTGE